MVDLWICNKKSGFGNRRKKTRRPSPMHTGRTTLKTKTLFLIFDRDGKICGKGNRRYDDASGR